MTDETETGTTGAGRVGMFFLSLIPWALATGLTAWLGLYIALHQFRRELSQEKRIATYIGAAEPVKDPINIAMELGGCVIVDRAESEGEDLIVYYHNHCGQLTCFIEPIWRLISPDGTVISSGGEYAEMNGGSSYLHAKEKGLVRLKIKPDERAKTLSLFVKSQEACG